MLSYRHYVQEYARVCSAIVNANNHCTNPHKEQVTRAAQRWGVACGTNQREGAPIHMAMINSSTTERNRGHVYCLMPSRNLQKRLIWTLHGCAIELLLPLSYWDPRWQALVESIGSFGITYYKPMGNLFYINSEQDALLIRTELIYECTIYKRPIPIHELRAEEGVGL